MNPTKLNLSSLMNKLEQFENQIGNKNVDLEQTEEKWKKMDQHVEEIIKNMNDVITLNIGGKKFITKIETLVSMKDTLFYKIVSSNKFNLQQELFFDRNPKIFPIIMDYLRSKNINYNKFSQDQLEDLKVESDYFEVK